MYVLSLLFSNLTFTVLLVTFLNDVSDHVTFLFKRLRWLPSGCRTNTKFLGMSYKDVSHLALQSLYLTSPLAPSHTLHTVSYDIATSDTAPSTLNVPCVLAQSLTLHLQCPCPQFSLFDLMQVLQEPAQMPPAPGQLIIFSSQSGLPQT